MTASNSNWLRLRQIALVAERLAPIEEEIIDVLGVELCHRDPGVKVFGLENALFPVGNQLLEVVAPIKENTAGGRYLERRGGNGGYMVITQCKDQPARKAHVESLGIRIINFHGAGEYHNMQLHPQDTGGAMFEIDEVTGPGALDPDGPWEPAGENWQRAKNLDRVTGIVAAEVQCDDPKHVAERWAEISEIPLDERDGILRLPLENGHVRFVPCTDGRPEGLGAIDISCSDKAPILNAAQARGLVSGENQVMVCGTRVNLL